MSMFDKRIILKILFVFKVFIMHITQKATEKLLFFCCLRLPKKYAPQSDDKNKA